MTISYTLATFRYQDKPTPVIEVNQHYWPISTVAPDLLPAESARGLMHLFADWEQSSKRLASLASRLSSEGAAGEVAVPKSANHILAPLSYPTKQMMMGANYLEHIQQDTDFRSDEHKSEFQSLMHKSYACISLKKKKKIK